MNSRILSFDTSSSSSGWAFFIDGRFYKYGVIDLKDNKDTNTRMKEMVSEIYKIIDYYSPAIVTIETPVVVRNPQVQRILTTIFGSVYGKCVEMKIDFYDLRPTEWRKLIDSGKKPRKRNELKEWSKQKVLELFNLNVNDDIADAILIGQAYINMYKN